MPGPSMFLAPGFLKAGDANADGRLSSGEFLGLGEKWFVEWDKARGGKLTTDQVRAGLNAVLALPGFGGRPPPGGGGAPRGPGAPGAPGGPVPGLNLQGPEGKRNGIASVLGIEFEYVRADLEFEGQRLDNVAVRFKGNGTFLESRGSLKRSLKIDLNRFVKGRKLAGVSKLNLQNNVTDATCMNEVLSYRLYRDAGVPAPRTAYARVWVTVPGKHDRTYLGLYSLSENVDNNFARDRFGTRKGAIFKPVTPELFADLGDDWAKYQQTYDPKTEVSLEETGRVIELCRLVSHADDAEFAARVFDYFDLDQVARYLAVLVWQCDFDSILGPGQNFYLYLHPQTRKFQFLPWDQDHSWGQFPMTGTPEQRENLSLLKPWQGERRFLDRLFKVDAFKQRYLARMEEFTRGFARWFEAWNTDRTGVLTDEQLRAGIDKDLSPFRGGPPGGPAFGPPPQP
ncbi:MAG: CotH kinase family protein [Limisphaerales bacterium]